MNRQRRSAPRIGSQAALTALQRDALRLLHQAAETADELGKDPWQFAVEIGQLCAAGLGNTDFRHLLCLGYVQHGQERSRSGSKRRIFEPLHTLVLPERTCFVLTAEGRKVASANGEEKRTTVQLPEVASPDERRLLLEVPHWDGKARQLWWQGLLIKELHRPACNQEIVLAAFEEEGWPMHLDDPLPRRPDIDPKARLHDTIKHLNRHHYHRRISFRGDGRARGVLWNVVASE